MLADKIPAKWTAPEALESRRFSTRTDVWGYGITFWEIMSNMGKPYEGVPVCGVMVAPVLACAQSMRRV